ncbi:hypothetical protein [Streptomyces sp. HPF1205]|uniref:hypothetical protein n=1 Tax=Streptomyces sp. HPF1205 TaxID=2873262 RepID=UPI001CEC87AD|nr:hypothetical protein [Streptomyces sp. HPF1205]
MRNKWGYIGYTALGFGSTVAGLAAAAGCSVGQGSPEGWRYLDTGTVTVAHPTSWHETRGGAVLRGADGRTEAALTVTPAPAPAPAPEGAGAAAEAPEAAPATGAEAAAPPESAAAVQAPGRPVQPVPPVPPVPPGSGRVRREEVRLDGRRAQVLSYTRPAPDGRPAGHVEVRTTDAAGHPVVIRAWALDGMADGPAVLREIVDSIQFTSVRRR